MKYEEMMVERQMVTGKRVLKDIKEVTERIVNEIEVNEMLFEQKICAVHELLKSLKLDFVLDYEDEENEEDEEDEEEDVLTSSCSLNEDRFRFFLPVAFVL